MLLLYFGASIDLPFSADGAYYFSQILDYQSFNYIDVYRRHSEYITQWPLVLAVRFGVTDLYFLKTIFALGLYIGLVISACFCLYALRGEDKTPALFFLASIFLVTLPASFFWVGEGHVVPMIAWPALFLLQRDRLTIADKIIVVLLLFILARTYQTAFASTAILSGIALLRWRDSTRKERAFFGLVLMQACLVVAICLYGIISPISADNRASFIGSIFHPFYRHPTFVISANALLFVMLGSYFRRTWLFAVAILSSLLCIALPLVGIMASAYESFASRTLTLTVLPVLLLLAAYARHTGHRADVRVIATTSILSVLLTAGYAASWLGWIEHRARFQTFLQEHSGYVTLDKTTRRFLNQNSAAWGWTWPLMSILWSDGCVRTIVLNHEKRSWQPFDPRESLPMQDYVDYDDAFDHALRKRDGGSQAVNSCSSEQR